jgi:hypothetical protein
VKYVGELKEGKYDGKGFSARYSSADGSLTRSYEGDFIKGKYDGQGVYTGYSTTNTMESYYSGGWKDGNKEGYGMLVKYFLGKMEGYYIGNWKDDKKDGYGTDSTSYTYLYKGDFVAGNREGKGKLHWASYLVDGKGDILKYDGEWKDDKINGTGIEYDRTGKKIFEGMFSGDKRHGSGKEYAANGTITTGVWTNGVKN